MAKSKKSIKKLSQSAKKVDDRRKKIIGDSENDPQWPFDDIKSNHPNGKREFKSKTIRPVKK